MTVAGPVSGDVAAPRRTLAGRLEYLLEQLGNVGPLGYEGDAVVRAMAIHLDRAVREARVQADELEILRGQAADRERALAVVQALTAELARLESLLPDLGQPTAVTETARWALGQIQDVIERAGRSVVPAPDSRDGEH